MRQPRRTEVVDRLLPAVPEINTLGSGNRKWPRGPGVCWPRSDSVDKWSILISEFEGFLFDIPGQDFKCQYHVIMSLKEGQFVILFFRYSFDVFREHCDYLWLVQLMFRSVFVERWFRPGSELWSPWGTELVWRQTFPLWAPHPFGNSWLSGILGSRPRFHRKFVAVQSSMFAPQSYSESFKELLVSEGFAPQSSFFLYFQYLSIKTPRDFVERTSRTAKMSSPRCWWPLWIWCFNTQSIVRSLFFPIPSEKM